MMRSYLPLMVIALTALDCRGSISEIRQDFFQQKANLKPQAIMVPPASDASFLISIYESSSTLATIPTLRWKDENGASQSAAAGPCAGAGVTCRQLARLIRVKAGSVPTIETNGSRGAVYSLYVSGLGFWTSGPPGQGGLLEVQGTADADQLVYSAASSISGLLVAYSEVEDGSQQLAYWDENGEHMVEVVYGSPLVLPVRIAGGTTVWAYNSSQGSANLWYGLVLFGTPADGDGSLGDFEYDLLDWTTATYPVVESGAQGLFAASIAQPRNSHGVAERLFIQGNSSSSGCDLSAASSGAPESCVGASSDLFQYWTVNSTGTMWGASPLYSAEIDVLVF